MGWDIKVWHESQGERARLIIDAEVEVPDDVISSIASSYWLEEIQYVDDEWEDPFAEPEPDSPPHIHG